jgi:hypothetical protein
MNLREIKAAIKRLKAERDGPHTMIEDLSYHLYAIDREIADLERAAKTATDRLTVDKDARMIHS